MLCELVTDSQGNAKARRQRNKEERQRLRLEDNEKNRILALE